MSTILIAEQEASLRERLAAFFRQQGHQVTEASEGAEASQLLDQYLFDVVLTEFRLPEKNGLEILHATKSNDELAPVLLLIDPDDMSSACAALKLGAHDYLLKPTQGDLSEIYLRVERALEWRRALKAINYLRHLHPHVVECEHILKHSAHLQYILNHLRHHMTSSAHVMIKGEPGTRKGLLAAAIHANSPRRDQTLVMINCAALPERALESEIFGYERDAFPGAHTRRIGGLEHANEGTICLYQIDSLSHRIQSKILRVLRERMFARLGSSKIIRADVRVVAATSCNLAEAVRSKRFRADLYAQLNTISVEMPVLRQCAEDIMPLAQIFLQRYRRVFGRRVKSFEENAERALLDYAWPGNLRELESTIANGVAHEEGEVMRRSSLSLGEGRSRTGTSKENVVRLPPNGIALKEIEREALLQALQRTNWVQKAAATHLDITPRVMHYKLKTHGITPPRQFHRR